jgi:hypothetical protein
MGQKVWEQLKTMSLLLFWLSSHLFLCASLYICSHLLSFMIPIQVTLNSFLALFILMYLLIFHLLFSMSSCWMVRKNKMLPRVLFLHADIRTKGLAGTILSTESTVFAPGTNVEPALSHENTVSADRVNLGPTHPMTTLHLLQGLKCGAPQILHTYYICSQD